MKKLLIGLVASSALVFGTGCGGDDGGDLCEDIADGYRALTDKVEGCPEIAQYLPNIDVDEEGLNECREAMDSCSDSDKDKYQAMADCLSDLPRCQSSNIEAWSAEFVACSEKIEGVSETCGE
ncbi:hypothetical protein [Corallococcus macrosporus]|uniref:Putative lipoprotein n=1 Tax=Corallococcus macrosporus DSM 14697 TaxID=1189310 RepID=A0A250JPV3_9BACT|nr:hypothetical protein [Corallococcus macrosporus]ATB45885.1 putative lipoprotein [Corallococcus macrosporus DSM 14697]